MDARRGVVPVVLTALALSASPGASTSAQEIDSLTVGSRVRLHGPALATQVGEIASLSAEGLTFAPEDGQAHSFEWSELSRMDVSVGRRSHTGHGALIGLGIGLVYGAVAASGNDTDMGSGFVFAVGGVIVGLPLAIVGAFVGSTVHSDVWQASPIPAAAPSGGVVVRIPH